MDGAQAGDAIAANPNPAPPTAPGAAAPGSPEGSAEDPIRGADAMSLPQAILAILVKRRSVVWTIPLLGSELRRVGKDATRAAITLALVDLEAHLAENVYMPFRLRRYGARCALEPVTEAAAVLMAMSMDIGARLTERQSEVLAVVIGLSRVNPPSRTAISECLGYDPVRELAHLAEHGLIYPMPAQHYDYWLPMAYRVCRHFGYRSLAEIPVAVEFGEAYAPGAKLQAVSRARRAANRELRHLVRIGRGPDGG